MRFDNTNIMKAIECFNNAYDAQKDLHKHGIDYRVLVNNKDYQQGIDHLNKQFDARINIRYIKTSDGVHGNLYTSVYNDIKPNVQISKSKGFQLGGMPIEIFVWDHILEQLSPNKSELFGQRITSYFCHEIFHNIAKAIRQENAQSYTMLTATLSIASSMKSGKARRVIITNYVNSLDKQKGVKKMSALEKKRLIKELCVLSSLQDDEDAIKKLHLDIAKENGFSSKDEYMDKLIEKYKKAIKQRTGHGKRAALSAVIAGACAVGSVLFPPSSTAYMVGGIGSLIFTLNAVDEGLSHSFYKERVKKFNSKKHMEEHYCDLFAGMYQLPITFFVGMPKSYKGKVTPNEVNLEKLKELSKLEVELHKAMLDVHPSDIERTQAGCRIAQKLLDSGEKLDPSVQKYCKWIVDNFSNATKVDIESIYNDRTFSTKEAEDLDMHLEKLINDNDIILTESYESWWKQ